MRDLGTIGLVGTSVAAAALWVGLSAKDYGPHYPKVTLSPRESECLFAAIQGHTNAKIAEGLGISEGAVRGYLNAALSKLGVMNVADANRRIQEGALEDPDV